MPVFTDADVSAFLASADVTYISWPFTKSAIYVLSKWRHTNSL